MSSVGELFKKFKIVDTRITKQTLDIDVGYDVKYFEEDELDGETIIITGKYKDNELAPSNNIVYLEVKVNPLDEKNTVIVSFSVPNNFRGMRIHDNTGVLHTIS